MSHQWSAENLRLQIVVPKPIQHFVPMYSSLASRPDCTVQVLYTEEAPGPYYDVAFGRMVDWGLDSDGLDWRSAKGCARRPWKLTGAIRSFDPDVVVIYGFGSASSATAIAYCKARGTPVAYISDSEDHRVQTPARLVASQALTTGVFRSIDVFLAVGDANTDYYLRRGVPAGKIVQAPFPIDPSVHDKAWEDREVSRRRIRSNLGISDGQVVVLTAGKVTIRKNHRELVDAVSLVDSKKVKLALVVAGSGPGEVDTSDWAETIDPHQLILPGFVEPSELASVLVASDIYVQPSVRDPHPLIVTEAGYCGLPLIVSHRCGIYGPTDDLQPGVNGFVYSLGSAKGLAAHIENLASDAQLRASMGEASRRIGLERQAQAHGGFIDDLHQVLTTVEA